MGLISIIMAVFIVLLFLGMPIAITIGFAVLAGMLIKGMPLIYLTQIMFYGVDSYALLAVPMFILAGYLMETGGITKRIVNFAYTLVGNVYGGLGIVTVIGCVFFAAISGSAPATVAAIGSMMIPSMVKKGYDVNFAGALTACSGSIGIMIPPSIPMIIYAVTAEVSVSDMFAAGFLPGIMIAIGLIIVTYFLSKKKGYKSNEEKFSFKRVLASIKESIWSLLAPVIILGGIYTGVFTATEASAIGVVYAFIIGLFVYKELKLPDMKKIILNTAIATGTIIILFGFATAFARFITIARIPEMISNYILQMTNNATIIYLFFVLIIFISGMFLDVSSMILIYTPLFLPLLTNLGVNPIHFGIVLIAGSQIGFVTPPVGVNLFVTQGITGTTIVDLTKAALWFLLSMLIVQIILVLIPDMVLFLPRLIGGNG